jgi:hypothetical protein
MAMIVIAVSSSSKVIPFDARIPHLLVFRQFLAEREFRAGKALPVREFAGVLPGFSRPAAYEGMLGLVVRIPCGTFT